MTKTYTTNLTLCFFLFSVSPVWAVQSHGVAEGLVSHLLGHLLFVGGLIVLLVKIHQKRFSGAGWWQFKGFLWLLIFWNCLTFGGHLLNEVVERDKFIKFNDYTVSFEVSTLIDLIFYITRMDHLLLVPAFILFYIALRRWEKDS